MTYPYACSRVYDMRQHTQLTKWGPFRNDHTDRVDWEKVEAISIVLGKNVKGLWGSAGVFDEVWDTPFWGSFPGSYVSLKDNEETEDTEMQEEEEEDLDKQDPYGVAGSWYRVSEQTQKAEWTSSVLTLTGRLLPRLQRLLSVQLHARLPHSARDTSPAPSRRRGHASHHNGAQSYLDRTARTGRRPGVAHCTL